MALPTQRTFGGRWTRAAQRACVVGLLAVALGACTTSRSTTDDTATDDSSPPRSALAEVETFDPSRYPVEPPRRDLGDIAHRVPERLMSSRAAENITRTVNGYRIQVYSAADKAAAEEFRERVRLWWSRVEDRAPEAAFSATPPLVIEYAQPYYRVRIGAFADRSRAQDALEFVQREFPDAFIARGTVTVTQ